MSLSVSLIATPGIAIDTFFDAKKNQEKKGALPSCSSMNPCYAIEIACCNLLKLLYRCVTNMD